MNLDIWKLILQNVIRVIILNLERLVRAGRRFPQARLWLQGWRTAVEAARWKHLQEVRQDFPHADGVRVKSGVVVTVFNAGGNDFRLLTTIAYISGRVFVHDVLTHAEYNKGAWRRRL